MTQATRRLPGIRFERQAPPLDEVLPRMDIAGFAGFAASGPIDVPVPVEDPAQFTRIFGADAPLAWDPARGENVSGHLGPAVRAFFRNGGRRCWVVRVANRDDAVADTFPLPGIAAAGDRRGRLELEPAVLPARSEGSWADRLSVSASLEPAPVRFEAQSLDALTFDAVLDTPGDLVPGDLVRVSFPGSPWSLLVGVAALGNPHDDDPQRRAVRGAPGLWVRQTAPATGRNGHVHFLGPHGSSHSVAATIVDAGPAASAEGLVRVELAQSSPPRPVGSPPDDVPSPTPGSLVRGVFRTQTIWLDVVEVDVARDGTRALVATAFLVTRTRPNARLVQAPGSLAERLTLRLEVHDDTGGTTVLGGLGFLPAHPRFVGALPTDAELYADGAAPTAPGTLWGDAAQPRFALAGPADPPLHYLPLGASILEGPALGAIRPAGSSRLRDGLQNLDERVFVDPGLGTVETSRLLDEAYWIEYRQPEPRPLRGMHALLGVEEVTIVAVPDATHRSWYITPGARIPPPESFVAGSPPDDAGDAPRLEPAADADGCNVTIRWSPVDAKGATYEVEWSREPSEEPPVTVYRGAATTFSEAPRESTAYYRVRALVGDTTSAWSEWTPRVRFLDCAARVPSAPTLEQVGDEESGVFMLVWSTTDAPNAVYELQGTSDPGDESAAELLYRGPQVEFSLYGRPAGSTLYYRVRGVAAGVAGIWSNWVVVRTTQTTRWLVDQVADYDAAETLLPIHGALLRMCAARGDLFAVLALPEHYRERDAIAHAQLLKAGSTAAEPDPVLSYGALYHPWLFVADPGNPQVIRRVPPDGSAAGVIAGRATRRGAWVAPANEPLHDVVQLDPPLGADWLQALQDAQVNVVRHEPAGFLWLAEDTLSDDPDLRPISVRRLLQVLRRAAVLHGATYVFEPNGDALHRTVRRAFERLLARVFELGGLAGRTASEAYRVNVGSPPNTPQSVDAGRLIVELKVAPSRPLAFLTIRLVRTGEGSLQVEAR